MKFFGTIALIFIAFWVFAQPNAGLSIPERICRNESFQALNTSTNAVQYFWEFAYGGLQTVAAANLGVTGATFAPDGLTIQYDAGNYVGFVVSTNSNNIVRLDFGNSLTNTPTQTDLGTLGGLLVRPRDIAIISYNNNWYGLVTNSNPATSTASILRLNFGSSLSNTPTVADLGTFSNRLSHPQTVHWVTEQGKLIALIGDRNQRKILMVDFDQSPTASSFEFREITFTGSGFFRDFSLVRGTDNWFGVALFENGGVHKINFGSGLFNTAQTIDLTADLPIFTFPSDVVLLRDVDRFTAVIAEYGGIIKTLDFGKDPASNFPVHQSLGNLGGLNNLQGLTFHKTNSGWIGFTHNIGTSWLHRLTFTGSSDASIATSRDDEPSISYSTSGIKYISLQVMDTKGESRYVTSSVLVKMDPVADFSFNLNCTNQNTLFQDESLTEGVLSWNWNFNDPTSGATTSTEQNPSHQFTSATNFSVELTVTDDCGNTDQAAQLVSVSNAATTTLNISADAFICSNQNKTYSLTSNATPIEEVVWDFGNGEFREEQTPTFTYSQPGEFTITANAIVNECIKQATQLVEVKRGAQVLFTASSQCEDTAIDFTHQITDNDIEEYRWTFPSGDIVEENPEYTFTTAGQYTVTLSVENSLGCETSLTKNINIYSLPQVDFTALAPPFSCNGTPTRFSDLTPPPSDSNLSTWLWNFGDTGNPSNTSTQRHPQHTYATAGDYSVSLMVTSNFLCSATLQKNVTIHQTPNAAFTHTVLCEDGIVTFSDAATNNQAWNWQIGSSFYTTQNAQHVFANPGTYPVTLSVTAANNCIGSSSQNVVINPKLVVDFSVLRNCANQDTEFTDLTNDASDPITDIYWMFGNLGSAEVNPSTFRFIETGTVDVTLTVTTQSGCAYPLTKPITIASGPLAAFTAEPNSGEAPLPVQFTNTSLNATTYAWNFGDGSTGNSFSPLFIYQNEGAYTIELIATDANNCTDISRQLIEVTEPARLDPPTPNPSTGVFAVEWNANEPANTTLTLVDATGREIRNFEVLANPGINRIVLDVTGEQTGLYILRVRHLKTVKTYRLIVSR